MASENEDAGAKPDTTTDNTKPEESSLGAAGKKALDQERKARRDAEKALRDAQDRVETLERDRLLAEVAAEKHLTPAQARRLQGSTKDELLADADDLLYAFGGARTDDDKPTGGTRRPREALRPGASPEGEPVEDASHIADRILGPAI